MFKRFIITSAALILSFPALAQDREYQSGIQSTKIETRLPKKDIAPPSEGTGMQSQTITRPDITARKTTHDSAEETPTSAESKIWNKYKELASGTATEEQTPDTNAPAVPVPSVEKPNAPQLTQPEQAPEKKKSGITSLLEQYQQNKDQQRQMQSRSFKTPPLPEQN